MKEISISQAQSLFMTRTYYWLAFGLFLTSFTALAIASIPALTYFFWVNHSIVYFSLLGSMFAISMLANKISSQVATGLYVGYSILVGMFLSVIFMIYTTASIFNCFFTATCMFAALAAYGHFTENNLSSMGTFLYMSMWGIFISSILNNFIFQSANFNWAFSLIGVAVFSLYAAYDSQNLKKMALYAMQDSEFFLKASIFGALNFHINFINLFIMLLNIMGRRRD